MSDAEHTVSSPIKQCSKCKEPFPATTEHCPPRKTSKDGLDHTCRVCHRKNARNYRATHLEECRTRNRTYNQTNRDHVLAQTRTWRKQNKQHIAVYNAAYLADNATAIHQRRHDQYYANIEESRAAARAYAKANPHIRENRRAREANAPIHDLTRHQWDTIKAHYKHRCVYCGKKPKRLEMDHLTPLAKGGSHTASNIVPACRSCNAKKHTGPVPIPIQPLLL